MHEKKKSKGFPPTVALHHLWRSKGLFVLTRHRNILQRKRRRRHRGRASQQVKLGIDRSINSIRNTLALHCINAETVRPREKQCTYPMHSVCESTGVKCMWKIDFPIHPTTDGSNWKRHGKICRFALVRVPSIALQSYALALTANSRHATAGGQLLRMSSSGGNRFMESGWLERVWLTKKRPLPDRHWRRWPRRIRLKCNPVCMPVFFKFICLWFHPLSRDQCNVPGNCGTDP